MRLVQKLSLAFLVGTGTLLAANGYFRVRREVAIVQADRVRDHDLIGRALGASFVEVWRSAGPERAMALVDAANAGEARVHIRWIWIDGAAVDGAAAGRGPRIPPAALLAMAPGTTLTRIAGDARGVDERFTYAPLRLGGRLGALELSEPLDAERRTARTIVVDTVGTTLALALVTTLLSYLLGSWLVGRPVRALVAKARRIGAGDFGGPVRLRQRDELGALADELNATSDQLVEAHDRVARETAARIAAIEQLRHADRLTTVGKLASGVAHELGTPLNVVAELRE
jgi:HAMP domain-containing protein